MDMENNTLDRLEGLIVNSEQISTSLTYEEQLLAEFFLDDSISNIVSEKLKSMEKLHNETLKLREEVDNLLTDIKQRHIQETSGEIGILYGNVHEKILYKIIQVLKDISKKHKINIICFKINGLDIENDCVKGILISSSGTRNIISNIPLLIYNMGYYTTADNRRKVKRLRLNKKIHIVNPSNRFNQYIIFDMISAAYKDHSVLLPYTMFSMSNLHHYLEQYDSIFLLPENKFTSRKCIVIKRNNINYDVCIGPSKKTSSKEELYNYLSKIIQHKKYFIMQGTNLIRFNNMPIEARVYIQKGCEGNWSVTEMVVKHELFSTDSIYNDKCYLLKEVLNEVIEEKSDAIVNKLGEDAINICTYLENYLSNVSSCILDFIITEQGENHLIYFGGMEDKEFLMRLDNEESWWRHFRNSMDYLLHVKNNKVIYDE
jgi:tetrahydromethanopterin S-methyltransferase subunit G